MKYLWSERFWEIHVFRHCKVIYKKIRKYCQLKRLVWKLRIQFLHKNFKNNGSWNSTWINQLKFSFINCKSNHMRCIWDNLKKDLNSKTCFSITEILQETKPITNCFNQLTSCPFFLVTFFYVGVRSEKNAHRSDLHFSSQ